jgi:proline dehydrogenase
MLARSLILKTSSLTPVERVVRRSFLFRGLVKRFIAGDTLEEAMGPTEELAGRGFFVSLDYLGENTKSEVEALAAKQAYIDMLERIDSSPGAPKTNISIKLTQCGLDLGDEFAEKNYRDVLEVAAQKNNFVRVDMESSDYTERTIRMIERVWKDYKNTGTVLQTYLYRTPEDVELMIDLGARVRLVKGAYLEPASVAHQDKAKVDQAFVDLGKDLIERGNYPALATHDEAIIDELNRFAAEKGIDKSKFEYQMLYGIRRDLQDKLLSEGYNMRVYIPYGDSWYPYFTRRLAERPANTLFIVKSLFRG